MDEDELYNLFEDTMKEFNNNFYPMKKHQQEKRNECTKFI